MTDATRPQPTLFTEFANMLDRTGRTPVNDPHRDPHGMVASQRIMMMLEKVRDFPVERLPEIERWLKTDESGKAVRKVERIIEEMQARMAQAPAKSAGDKEDRSDERIARWANDVLAYACGCGDERCEKRLRELESLV